MTVTIEQLQADLKALQQVTSRLIYWFPDERVFRKIGVVGNEPLKALENARKLLVKQRKDG